MRKILLAKPILSVKPILLPKKIYFTFIYICLFCLITDLSTATGVVSNKDSVISNKDSVVSNKDSVISNKTGVVPNKTGVVPNKTGVIPNEVGIMLCTENGTILYSQNKDKKFIPASTLKVLTTLFARYYLGSDYRFKTDFFFNTHQGNLKIKGYGDPLFTSEVIIDACHQLTILLKSMNVSVINDIIVDNSFFSSTIKIDGSAGSNNPYDAFIGPLCANFNTVSFIYNKEKQSYISAESQTPLLPFVMQRVKESGLNEGRIILSKQESEMYAGMLIKHFLSKNGIIIKGKVITANEKKEDITFQNINNDHNINNNQLIYTWTSPYNIDEILRRVLKYSSNFMANQLFLSAGAKAFSPPATIEKGIAAMTNYFQKTCGIYDAEFAEGSGLSRKNRISPSDMIKVLKKFKINYKLMESDQISNRGDKILNRSDKISNRSDKILNGGNEYYKTGTLTGVRTRCGYFETSKGFYLFVIMINENGVSSNKIRYYDKIRHFLWKKICDYEKDF